MKNILILANSAVGLYNFRFELIKTLIKNKFEVYFSVPDIIENKKVQLIISLGAKYIYTPINRRGINPFDDFKLIMKYVSILKRVNPDVVLTYTIKPNIYGAYAANKFKKPVIMNITGVGSAMANSWLKNLVKKMYAHACNKARLVFFQNEFNQEFFIKNNIVNMEKTKLIPGSGVNINKFRPLAKTNKDNKIKFLFIGRIMKEKGIEEYLEAADVITKKFANTEFHILGRFEENRYKKIITGNSNPRIKYLGVSDDVRNQIREVDCIVHPTFYPEGMSNVLLEGAAMGKPLIASNIPGCKEIIKHDYNGFLFEPKSVKSLEEKLIKFIKLDNSARELMGKRSREKVVKEFDRNIVINEYIKAINIVLQ